MMNTQEDVSQAVTQAEEMAPRHWDIVVRATHWLVAAAVLTNSLFTEEGSDWHVWVGYALAAVLLLRLLWGLVGSQEARFSAFPPSPSRAIRHIQQIVDKQHVRHRSHNPLGALMAYALWATLIVIIASGVAMAGSPLEPQAKHAREAALSVPATMTLIPAAWADDDDEAEEAGDAEKGDAAEGGAGGEQEEGVMAEVHEAAVNVLYLLILLHLAGVVFETRRSGRQIIMAMLPKRR